MLAIAVFVVALALCEMIAYQLANVSDRLFLTLEMKAKDVDDSVANRQANFLCQRATSAKIGASRPDRLFAVHIVTDVRTSVQHARITQCNSVETIS